MIYHGCTYNEKLLLIRKHRALAYRQGRLFIKNMNSGVVDPISISAQLTGHKVLSRIRLVERLLRLEPRFAVSCGDDFALLSWAGSLYLVDFVGRNAKRIYQYRSGMHNPLMIARISNIHGFKDGYIFGDYWSNQNGEEASIYRTDTVICDKVFSFPKQSVLHIHGCVPDPIRNRVLILTGDSDNQTAIWAATDDFRVMTPILKGCQQYRACAAYPDKDGFIYATDTPLVKNGIYYYSESTQVLQKLYDMPGPCIYSTAFRNKKGATQYVFATSVEPDSSLPWWRYWTTGRLGCGVKENKVHLLIGNCETGFSSVCSFPKDVWPMALFQFGNLQFPDQDMYGGLFINAIAIKKYDGKTMQFLFER